MRGQSSREFVKGMSRQVGWFVILGAGALVLVLLVSTIRTDIFAQKFNIYFSPPSAASFYTGQPVKFQGFAIGRVNHIELLEQGNVKVTLRLLERYRRMLHQGAKVKLVKEGLIGEQVVELTPGIVGMPSLKANRSIVYETEASIEQLLQDLKPAVSNANVLLKELAEFSVWINNPEGDFRKSVQGFRELSRGFKAEDVPRLMQGLTAVLQQIEAVTHQLSDEEVVKRLSESLQLATGILDGIQPLTQAMGQDGPETFKQVGKLIRHIDTLTSSLNIVADDLSELTPELPGLARESRKTIEEIQGLVGGLRGSWLFDSESSNEHDDESIAPPLLDMQP
ncbi:MAG: MlaD family protein [Mariprofundaceae bacterium]